MCRKLVASLSMPVPSAQGARSSEQQTGARRSPDMLLLQTALSFLLQAESAVPVHDTPKQQEAFGPNIQSMPAMLEFAFLCKGTP